MYVMPMSVLIVFVAVVYGGIPEEVFSCCYASGTKIVHFPGGFYAGRKKEST